MRPRWRLLALALLLAGPLCGALLGDRLLAVSGDARDNLKRYTSLIETARARYGGDVTYKDLVFASIQGMLRSLDPHTNFLSPDAFSSMREKQQASFYGLGILVGMRAGRVTVIAPIDGTPASRLGIRAGDIIHRVEGEPTEKLSLDEVVSRLKGPKDTQVNITILRAGFDEPLELTVTRAEIPQTTVRYAYMLEPGTGYVSISDFNRATGDEVARAIEKLRGEGMERLLLDLRNNGGGLLDQAVAVADQFLPAGATIVETRGRVRDSVQGFAADGQRSPVDVPVVVLVNGGTASAAEILSGAIQDHDVGLVVGTPTWGKGLVQTVYNLSYGAGLALTTARYYTPSGRLIQRDYSSYFDYYARTDLDRSEGSDEPRPEQEPSEIFHTDLGRKVYGGGGITPDVEVEPAEVAPFLQFLLARSAYFRFSVEYSNTHPNLDRGWRPRAEVLDEFGRYLVDQGIDSAEDVKEGFSVPEHRDYALRQIRAEVMSSKFGVEAAHRVLAGGDAQIQTALGLFPRASELLAERRRLGRAPEVRAEIPAEPDRN